MNLMMKQLPLDLPPVHNDEFVRSKANDEAVRAILSENWHYPVYALIGDKHSGKSVFARELERYQGAKRIAKISAVEQVLQDDAARFVIIDQVENFQGAGEEALFHLYNAVKMHNGRMLLIMNTPPNQLNFELADWKSRILTAPQWFFYEPDDWLLSQLLAQAFFQRGIMVSQDVIAYLSRRIERSYEAAQMAVETLNHKAQAEKSSISRTMVKAYLEDL